MIYLNIGSNLPFELDKKIKNIEKSVNLLSNYVNIKKISKLYLTPSYPDKSKPKFINLCISIETSISINRLLSILKKIEKKMGRVRRYKNSPRTCDLDIIDFKRKIINNNSITVPHPRLHLRNFVLYPLKDISPNWKHPILNKKIDQLINKLNLKSRLEITRLHKSVMIKK
tara:strand:+ start:1364 stop:1876 length:513 start_codon:yes stop_codon:yes gene_type:complete